MPRRHRAERAAALAHVAQNLYRRGERTLGVMPLYHTMGVRSLLAMALIDGCFICLPRFDAGACAAADRAASGSPTSIWCPTLYHDLISHADFAAGRCFQLTKLGFAGAAMPDGLLKRVAAAFRPQLFVNHYGSSEIYTFTIEPRRGGETRFGRQGGAQPAHPRGAARRRRCRTRSPHPARRARSSPTCAGDEAFEGYWRRPDADARALRQRLVLHRRYRLSRRRRRSFRHRPGRRHDHHAAARTSRPARSRACCRCIPAIGRGRRRRSRPTSAGASASPPSSRAAARSTPLALDAWCRASALADYKRPRDYVFVAEIPKSPVGKILRRLLVAGDYRKE